MNSEKKCKVLQLCNRATKYADELKSLKAQIDGFDKKIAECDVKIDDYDRCICIFNYIVQSGCEEIISSFEKVISGGLKDVFDDSYEFQFKLSKTAKNTTCEFAIKTDACPEFIELTMTRGRSVKEVIGVILRLLVINIDTQMNRFLVLDEPLGGLEPERQPIAREFLRNVAKRFNIQLLIVTQSNEFNQEADNKVTI